MPNLNDLIKYCIDQQYSKYYCTPAADISLIETIYMIQ